MKTGVGPSLTLAFGLISVAMLVITFGDFATAFNHKFPDYNDTEGKAIVFNSNGQSRFVRKQDSQVRVWSTSRDVSFYIVNGHFCSTNQYDYLQSGDEIPGFRAISHDTNITRFTATAGSTSVVEYGKKYASGNSRCDNDISFSFSGIPKSNYQNGYYYVDLSIDNVDQGAGFDGIMNYYRIIGDDNTTKIGLSAASSGHDATQEQVDTRPSNVTYYAEFGTPCSQTNDQPAEIVFYDLDNDDGGGSGDAQQGGNITVRLRDQTAGSWVNFTTAGVGTTWTPPSVVNDIQSVRFNARPNHKYTLHIINVYWNNTIQYSLPYSQIYAEDCVSADVVANASVSSPTVQIGSSVTFTNTVTVSNSNMPNNFNFSVETVTTGIGGSWEPNSEETTSASLINGQKIINSDAVLTIPNDPSYVGRVFCRESKFSGAPAEVSPRSGSDSACVTVVSDYSLTPVLSGPSGTASLGNANVNVNYGVNKAGPSISDPTDWRLSRFILASGDPVPGFNSANPPCDVAADCVVIDNDPSETISSDWSNSIYDNVPSAGLSIGSKICYVMSLTPPSSTSTGWSHSSVLCVTVAKEPFVHIWGNDLRVGSDWLSTSSNKNSGIFGLTTTANGLTYGSWGEYGVLAPNSVARFGSAAGLVNGNASSLQSDWSGLTFANTGGTFGSFVSDPASMGLLPDVRSYISRFDADPNVRVQVSGTVLTGWPGGSERHRVLQRLTTGTTTINIRQNINRPIPPGGYGDVEAMPQLIIIADNINIESDVTNIDAWLIATNVIDTCGDVSSPLTTGVCDKQLTINGPVMARQLLLRRTAGSNDVATLNEPAERINMPASTYIWARHYDEKYGRLQTVSTRELPPRY